MFDGDGECDCAIAVTMDSMELLHVCSVVRVYLTIPVHLFATSGVVSSLTVEGENS